MRKLVKLLRDEGYRVGVIKSTKHTGLQMDQPGSDSFLYRQDGTEYVALVSPDKTVMFQDTHREEDLRHLSFRLFPHADIVIGEGFKHVPGIPKIEVARAALGADLLKNQVPDVLAVVSDFNVQGVKNFSIEDVEGLCAFLKKQFLEKDESKPAASLFVNGQPVPLTYFVQNCLTYTIFGFTRALRATEGAEEIEIRVRLRDGSSSSL